MPDEVVDSPQPPDSGAGSAPEVAPVADTQASVAPEVQAGDGGSGQGAGGSPTPAPAPAQPSFRDVVAGHGVDVSQFADDAQLAQALAYGYRGYQSARPHIEMSSRWLPYASEIREFLESKRQAQPQGQQPSKPWHGLPEYDPMWRHQITRNEQGEYVPIPGSGGTLETVRKFQEYANARRQFEDKFYTNPVEALKPGLEEFVQPLVRQAIQQSLAQQQEYQHAQSYVQRNADWLYARDAQGNELRDPISGGKVLSPYGDRFAGYLREAGGLGIQGAENQQKYAQALLERDLAVMGAMNGTQQAPAVGQSQPKGVYQPNRSGTLSGQLNGNAPPQNRLLRLRDQMRDDFAAAGIKDSDLFAPE